MLNKTRVAKSRLNKRAEMGEEAYKAQEALKRKNRRDRAKIKDEMKDQIDSSRKTLVVIAKTLIEEAGKRPKVVNVPAVSAVIEDEALPILARLNADDTCEAVFQKILKAKQETAETIDKVIDEASVKSQFDKVQNIYKKMNDKRDCSNFEWLRDTDGVLDFIGNHAKWKTDDTRSSQIQAIASILKVIDGFQKEYKIYSKQSTKKRVETNKQKAKNLSTDRERNLLPWTTIKTAWDSKNNSLSEKDRALVAIYVLLAPRRVEVIGSLIIQSKSAKMDLSKNYLIIKDKTPIEFVYNKYKTSKVYKTQKIPIPKTLAVILQAHIKKSTLKTGDYLFATRSGTQYANFSTQITDAFSGIEKTSITANLLRHSYISWFLSQKVQSLEAKNNLARKMGTSTAMLDQYLRLDISTQI
jgi:alkylhydroperoxidase/carboxymuconolactone decarboxylase family protein YurZ